MRRATLKLLGQTFGRLTVKGKSAGRARYWDCQCSCGGSTQVRADHLRNGKIRSCGCGKIVCAQTVAGSISPTYEVWKRIMARCRRSSSTLAASHDPRWRHFKNFFEDMGVQPADKILSRLNAFHGYRPGNCHWTDDHCELRNKRGLIYLTYNRHGELRTAATAGEWATTLRALTGRVWTIQDVRREIELLGLDRLISSCLVDAPHTAVSPNSIQEQET